MDTFRAVSVLCKQGNVKTIVEKKKITGSVHWSLTVPLLWLRLAKAEKLMEKIKIKEICKDTAVIYNLFPDLGINFDSIKHVTFGHD